MGEQRDDDADSARVGSETDGRDIVAWSWGATAILVVVLGAAVAAPDTLGVPAAVISLVLFAIGIVVFLAAFAIAVGRSRTEDVSVAGLYLLSEGAPPGIRRHLLTSLAVQVIASVAAASLRPFTPVAFGLLVPTLGMGLAGLWSARHGVFRPRPPTPPRRRTGQLATGTRTGDDTLSDESDEAARGDVGSEATCTTTRRETQMLDEATETRIISASPARCFAVAADVESYGEWTADLKDATVVERDDDGRPTLVEFRAAAMGRSTTYVLRYDHSETPERLSWVQDSGDITRRLDGWYLFAPVDGEPDQCEVTYHLEVELIVPLPGFVKRRAEGRIIHTALDDLQTRAEG